MPLVAEASQVIEPACSSIEAIVPLAEQLGDQLFARAEDAGDGLPIEAVASLHRAGLLAAPLAPSLGGVGLGIEPGSHLALLRVLSSIGGADLALGRLFEGHVNALILVHHFGSSEQKRRAAVDVQQGLLFGVWNTGSPVPMRLKREGDALTLEGMKTFATGAGFVQRPIITVEDRGWQMTLPRMDDAAVAPHIRLDREAWHPLGMESSGSLTIDFTGAELTEADLIGGPGDFYRDPLFRGGAIRFAAVQAGALLRLQRLFSAWLVARGRQADPYQLARAGEIAILTQTAVFWIERAAEVAEASLASGVTGQQAAADQLVHWGNLARVAIEHAATAVMGQLVPGIGAHGLLRPARFERILRDLTMYLRQPNPDGALADIGRATVARQGVTAWRS